MCKLVTWFLINDGIDLCCDMSLLSDIHDYLYKNWLCWFNDLQTNYNFRDYCNCDNMVLSDIHEHFDDRIYSLALIEPTH